jgi:hypothetical protein
VSWRAGQGGLTCCSCLIGVLGCMKDKDVPWHPVGLLSVDEPTSGRFKAVSSERGVRRFGTGCGVWRGVHVSIHW